MQFWLLTNGFCSLHCTLSPTPCKTLGTGVAVCKLHVYRGQLLLACGV